jgi:tryptophan-associated transmembrane protein
METAPRLDASRPSSLRALGFALTAAGALAMGVGSLLDWITVGLRDLTSLQTTIPGTDVGAGRIALVAAVIVLVLVIVSRVVAGPARRWIALVIVVAAGVATVISTWFVVSAADHFSPVDDETLVNAVAQATGKSADEVRTALVSVIDQLGGYTHVGPGPWVAIVGGLLAIAGGVITYVWASRVAAEPTELPPH